MKIVHLRRLRGDNSPRPTTEDLWGLSTPLHDLLTQKEAEIFCHKQDFEVMLHRIGRKLESGEINPDVFHENVTLGADDLLKSLILIRHYANPQTPLYVDQDRDTETRHGDGPQFVPFDSKWHHAPTCSLYDQNVLHCASSRLALAKDTDPYEIGHVLHLSKAIIHEECLAFIKACKGDMRHAPELHFVESLAKQIERGFTPKR